jgi:hypothetical protein
MPCFCELSRLMGDVSWFLRVRGWEPLVTFVWMGLMGVRAARALQHELDDLVPTSFKSTLRCRCRHIISGVLCVDSVCSACDI